MFSILNRYDLVCLALTVWAALAGHASAQQGGPPVGSWFGKHADGSGSLTFVLQANGTCLYGPSGVAPIVGRGSWKQTSPVGGIVAIRYSNGPFENNLYYSITWIDGNTIVLSDPFFRVTLRRQ
jgi:hypothetical protein